MKLLLLTEFFPASDAVELTGGIEAVCYYLSKHLNANEDVSVCVRARHTDGQVWEFTALSSLPRRIRFLATTLVGCLRDEFDVIEGTNQLLHPIAWLAGRLRGRPVVYLYADVLIGQWHRHFGVAGWLGELVERLNLRLRPDHVIAISNVVRDKLVRAGIPEDRVSVVPCGYDDALVRRVVAEGPEKTASLVTVSRLVPYKGVHVVLEAMARLVRSGHDITLRVVGQGPELARLRRQAELLCVADRVEFLGHLTSHADVLRAIARSQIFVSASRIEGFGIALVEAMALGVPFVASDIAAFREVTGGGRGGHLCQTGDAAAMAAGIAALLTQPAEYRAASESARDRANCYRWAQTAETTATILHRLVADPRRRWLRIGCVPPRTCDHRGDRASVHGAQLHA